MSRREPRLYRWRDLFRDPADLTSEALEVLLQEIITRFRELPRPGDLALVVGQDDEGLARRLTVARTLPDGNEKPGPIRVEVEEGLGRHGWGLRL